MHINSLLTSSEEYLLSNGTQNLLVRTSGSIDFLLPLIYYMEALSSHSSSD